MNTQPAVIDQELAIKLAGNKKEIAEEILNLFMQDLPKDIFAIKELYQTKNHSGLLQRIHKLHGAICYCGLPRLKGVVARLESELRNNVLTNLHNLFEQLDTETQLLVEHYAKRS